MMGISEESLICILFLTCKILNQIFFFVIWENISDETSLAFVSAESYEHRNLISFDRFYQKWCKTLEIWIQWFFESQHRSMLAYGTSTKMVMLI